MLVNLKRNETARCFSSSLQKLERKNRWIIIIIIKIIIIVVVVVVIIIIII